MSDEVGTSRIHRSTADVQQSELGPPQRRIILLGASNLTRGISTVVETAQQIWGQPLEVLTALGHGRSYGIESTLLGRSLPGILNSHLWEVLRAKPSLPTAVLATDIGNDLLYEVEVEQIAQWLGEILDRFQGTDVRISMTGLPVAGIAKLGPARFKFFAKLFFPRCRLTLTEAADRARRLNELLVTMAAARGVKLVEQTDDWYGFDPIHIRLRHWPGAWGRILSSWNLQESATMPRARGSLGRWLYLRSRRPHYRKLFGWEQRQEQPAASLRDGTTISFY